MGDRKTAELVQTDQPRTRDGGETGGSSDEPYAIVIGRETAIAFFSGLIDCVGSGSTASGAGGEQAENVVPLTITRRTAITIYRALLPSGSWSGEPFVIIVKKHVSQELLKSLARGLAPSLTNKDGEQVEDEATAAMIEPESTGDALITLMIDRQTANELYVAMTIGLGGVPRGAPRETDTIEPPSDDPVESPSDKARGSAEQIPPGGGGAFGRLEAARKRPRVFELRDDAPGSLEWLLRKREEAYRRHETPIADGQGNERRLTRGKPPSFGIGEGKPTPSLAPPRPPGGERSRYVNLWFTRDRADESYIDKTFELAFDREVYLRVNIGPFDMRTIMNVEEAKEFVSDETLAAAFPETVGKPVPLEVTVFSNDFHVPDRERTQKFDLVPGRPTAPLYFPVTPRQIASAHLRVCVFYRNHLLQSLRVEAPVSEQARPGSRPQRAEVEVTFSSGFTSVGVLPPRGLWLGLNQNSDYTHTLNVKNSQRALSRNMESQIETALVKAREALLKVSFRPKTDYAGKIELDANGQPKKDYRFGQDNSLNHLSDEARIKRFREDLTILAAAGRNLYQAVFGSVPTAEERAQVQPVVDEMKTTLREAQIIQVTRLKKMEDIWPWALMYDSVIDPDNVREVCLAYRGQDGQALPYAEGVKQCLHRHPMTRRNLDKTVVCPYGFWGFKHIIEQPTQPGGRKAFADLVFEIRMPTEPVLQMLVENTLGQIEASHITSMQELRFKALTSLQEFTAGLDPSSQPPPPEPHVVYFFCHGKYDAQQSPYLEVGTKEALLPSELDELDFRWANSHGLVFINGCHTAELQPKDLSSIMQPFVEADASGIIGTEISVTTFLAREFAQEFFKRFLAHDNQAGRVGQIIKDLRLALLMKYNPLGLVYTPYCSADLHVIY